MNLRETTRDIISVSQVEQLTGQPVEVVEDSSLQTTAIVHMASHRSVPAHLVRYNPPRASWVPAFGSDQSKNKPVTG